MKFKHSLNILKSHIREDIVVYFLRFFNRSFLLKDIYVQDIKYN